MINLFQIGVACEDIMPIVKFIRNGVMPIIFLGIPIILIVFGSIDLGKAVFSQDDKEIKGATGKLIKRIIYAIVIFFIPSIVNLAMGLVATAEDSDITTTAGSANETFADCWKAAKK